MQHRTHRRSGIAAALAVLGCVAATPAHAQIIGLQGSNFALTAKADRISTPDGNSILIWGFAAGLGRAQYPGPTLLVNAPGPVTISVTNQLPASANQRVSLTFPGQKGVTAECTTPPCVQGPLSLEAGLGGRVTYSFLASAGTFHYASGSQADLQIEMGLVGALIVGSGTANQAYPATPDSAYDQEYLFLLSEMDSHIHDLLEAEGVEAVYRSNMLSNYFPNYWFINGRNAPDTMAGNGGSQFPTQPYGSLVRTHLGDRVLMRIIGAGHDLHPFHHHGNHARVIAVDGQLLKSAAASPGSIDLSHEVFTIQSVPGQTVDAVFSWTGKDLGWDAFGTGPERAHPCNGIAVDAPVPGSAGFDPDTREYCPDHGKPIPVVIPDQLSTDFGGFYSGSPFLGHLGLLPPGMGGLNPDAGYTFMWHSHTEKEITNFDVFPGGMMTMLVVLPMGVPIS